MRPNSKVPVSKLGVCLIFAIIPVCYMSLLEGLGAFGTHGAEETRNKPQWPQESAHRTVSSMENAGGYASASGDSSFKGCKRASAELLWFKRKVAGREAQWGHTMRRGRVQTHASRTPHATHRRLRLAISELVGSNKNLKLICSLSPAQA